MMNKFFLIILLITSLVISGYSQVTFDFSANQVKVWELAKRRTIVVAEAMPEDKYNYRPTEGVMTFAEQTHHISNSMLSMNTRFILKQSYAGKGNGVSAKSSKADIIGDLEDSFDQVITSLRSMSDEDLQAEGKSHGNFALTKWQSFLVMRDHITNHRAKMVLYLRMNGITPPRYGFN